MSSYFPPYKQPRTLWLAFTISNVEKQDRLIKRANPKIVL